MLKYPAKVEPELCVVTLSLPVIYLSTELPSATTASFYLVITQGMGNAVACIMETGGRDTSTLHYDPLDHAMGGG